MPLQSFRDLTGMPVERFETAKQTQEEFFKIVHGADKRKWSMVGTCMVSAFGLHDMHAYTILDSIILKKDGKPFQELVKMRNPWGSENYNGDWSDGDSKWTPDLMKQAGHVSCDDG